jgi:hypothetical protein
MIVFARSLQTIAAALVLLSISACIVTFAPASPTDAPTLAPTSTATPEWFPPTLTPSPLPTAVHSPTPELRPHGDLLLEDDFSSEENWTTTSSDDGTISISGGNLHLSLNEQRSYLFGLRTSPVFRDFYAEITASPRLCRGEDEYGFILRANDGDHYRFALSCDGRAKVDRFQGSSLTRQAGWLQERVVPSIAPSTSRLGVWAVGSEIRFFVNDFYLFSVNDTQLYLGTLGVFVHTSGEEDVSVNFSDLKVWEISG